MIYGINIISESYFRFNREEIAMQDHYPLIYLSYIALFHPRIIRRIRRKSQDGIHKLIRHLYGEFKYQEWMENFLLINSINSKGKLDKR
ncbi:hypothetical protein RCL_jg13926.t1 [Rhizophagus clarus]|uniref:Uncharacterized protein n=1 Tax=Rhizophagus clarus TaxID=94130 RepID=A0A8H3LS30_9GLOM|nr:hypothetical protein RCL_jg13926.t1 [Rhizophagus clarus]